MTKSAPLHDMAEPMRPAKTLSNELLPAPELPMMAVKHDSGHTPWHPDRIVFVSVFEVRTRSSMARHSRLTLCDAARNVNSSSCLDASMSASLVAPPLVWSSTSVDDIVVVLGVVVWFCV